MKHIQQALTKYWGYDDFLPLQKEAMEALHHGRDCIVVLHGQ
jgi:superfamily II DNA helicase RecQ